MEEDKRGKYQGLSLPVSLIDEVKKHNQKHPEYKGVTEFVRQAVREKMHSDILTRQEREIKELKKEIKRLCKMVSISSEALE